MSSVPTYSSTDLSDLVEDYLRDTALPPAAAVMEDFLGWLQRSEDLAEILAVQVAREDDGLLDAGLDADEDEPHCCDGNEEACCHD